MTVFTLMAGVFYFNVGYTVSINIPKDNASFEKRRLLLFIPASISRIDIHFASRIAEGPGLRIAISISVIHENGLA